MNVLWQDLSLRQTSQQEALFDAWKALKSIFGRGSAPLRPGTHWRSSRRSSRQPSRLGSFIDVMMLWGFPLTNVFWRDVNVRQTPKREVFGDARKTVKSAFGRGSSGEAHDSSLDPLVDWERETPSPFSTLLDAFGASNPIPTQPSPLPPYGRAFWIRPWLCDILIVCLMMTWEEF